MSRFISRAMENVEKKPEAPKVSVPLFQYEPVLDAGTVRTDLDLAKLSSEEFQEEFFLAVSAAYLNSVQGVEDFAARKRVLNKVARTFNAHLDNLRKNVNAAIRAIDAPLEGDLKAELLIPGNGPDEPVSNPV